MSSLLKTNSISAATGSTVSIPSGTTLDIASGATITNSGTATGFGGDNTPVFEATMSANMSSVGTNTWAKVEFDSEVFDSDSAYDPTTNYRFTVPSGENGKYFIYSSIYLEGDPMARAMIAIYKNGSAYRANHNNWGNTYVVKNFHFCIHAVLDLAVSDYLEIYFYANRSDSGNIVAGHQTSDQSVKTPVFGGFKLV